MIGILNWKVCEVCGEWYDYQECPFCRENKLKRDERKKSRFYGKRRF